MHYIPNAYSGGAIVTANGKSTKTYIQDFTKSMCESQASSASKTVYDKRDENDYQVRYINGNCWMVQNLRFTGTELSSTTSNVASTYTDTSPYKINNTGAWGDLTSGNSYDEARLHNSGNKTNGIWYNYAGLSAGTITGTNNINTLRYDICPKGWRIPTNTENNTLISYKDDFSPVTGGYYNNAGIDEPNAGVWWSATLPSTSRPTSRYYLYYGSNLGPGENARFLGFWIRCIRSN